MELQDVIAALESPTEATPARDADVVVPKASGLYSIFVDAPDSLPEPFAGYLRSRDRRLIYVGRSLDSLHRRLVMQDLRQKNHSTFFRSIGAVLGYRPPCGSLVGKGNQNNYVFGQEDTRQLIRWIDQHLSVRWLQVDASVVPTWEPAVIRELEPLLNDTHNPASLPELRRAREECRNLARRPPNGVREDGA